MKKREWGYYWVNYPKTHWQIAHWNGRCWNTCGSMDDITKVKEVGGFLGKAYLVDQNEC